MLQCSVQLEINHTLHRQHCHVCHHLLFWTLSVL